MGRSSKRTLACNFLLFSTGDPRSVEFPNPRTGIEVAMSPEILEIL
jgi:hypothetical protein